MILIDTNILCRLVNDQHPHYQTTTGALERLLTTDGQELFLGVQSLYELFFVLTKPANHNGFGYTAERANIELTRARHMYSILYETSGSFQIWNDLVIKYKITSRPVFDARLVAVMIENNIREILTFNDQDFRFFSEISVINPFDYLNIPRVP